MYATMDTPESRYEINKGVSIKRVSVIFMFMCVRINHAALKDTRKVTQICRDSTTTSRSKMQSAMKYAGNS